MSEQFQLSWHDGVYGSQADYIDSSLGPMATCHVWEMPDGSWQAGVTWGKQNNDADIKVEPVRSKRNLHSREMAKGWCEGRFMFVASMRSKKEPAQ